VHNVTGRTSIALITRGGDLEITDCGHDLEWKESSAEYLLVTDVTWLSMNARNSLKEVLLRIAQIRSHLTEVVVTLW
jgi:dTDP-glucose pyrophosphorylase